MVLFARLVAVLVTGVALQVAVFSQLRPAGVAVEVMLCLTIAAGLSSGERRGAVTGFFCGVMADLLLPTRPFGLSAMVFAVTGYLVGRYHASTARASRALTMFIAAVSTAGALLAYLVLARVLGGLDLFGPNTWLTFAVLVPANALLVLAVRHVTAWAWDERPAQRTGPRIRYRS